MIARTRRSDAAGQPADFYGKRTTNQWHEACRIRQEWLGHGLSTDPADRRTAEDSLTRIYALMARPRPRFVWVESPHQAIPLVAGLPTLDQLYALVRDPRPRRQPPAASDLAMVVSQLRGKLSAAVDPELSPARKDKHNKPFPELPPRESFEAGVPFGIVLHRGIHDALHRSLAVGFRYRVREALGVGGPVPVCWSGQQDAAWVAYYDVLQRLGLARYGPAEAEQLDHWAALARSCGWWWPGEDVCVVVERPELARTEPLPGAWHDEVRLRRNGLRYRDGWQPLLT
ncbi:DUF6745 domain-containing protein [Flindersiella endophytica]